MQLKQTVMATIAVVVIVVAVVLVVKQLGSDPTNQDPIAQWVCDACGATATVPLENQSPDCEKCDKGQMIQRVYFRCKRCEKLFEAYQVNWSPTAPRAVDNCAEADEQEPLPEGVPKDQAILVRRPGGKWLWGDASLGRQIMTQLACPKCGAGKRDQFTKVLNPTEE